MIFTIIKRSTANKLDDRTFSKLVACFWRQTTLLPMTSTVAVTISMSTLAAVSSALLYDTDLKQWSDVHIKAQVGEPCGNDFGPSVVTILPHLCHKQSGVPALMLLKICNSEIGKNTTTLFMDLRHIKSIILAECPRYCLVLLSTCCEPRWSRRAPQTRCGKPRSPSWCWPYVHQTLSSWHQWFHRRSICRKEQTIYFHFQW